MKKTNKKNNSLFLTLSFFIILYLLFFSLLYNILGESGGLYYIGSYSPFIIFLVFFIIGLPYFVASLVSKQEMFGYKQNNERILRILGINYCFFSILLIILIFIFSNTISDLIINSNGLSLSIRILSVSLLFAPFLGIYRGYFEGINNKEYSIISKFLEVSINFIAVIVIYIIKLKVKIPLTKTINILLIINILSYILSFLFLWFKKKTINKKSINQSKISIKAILKRSIKDSILNSIMYIYIVFCFVLDILFLKNILVNKLNYRMNSYEVINSTISIWGIFLIILYVVIILKLIGDIRNLINKYFVQKDIKKIAINISRVYKKCLFFSIPAAVLACFSAHKLWNIIYSYSKYGILTYQCMTILIFGIIIFIVSSKILIYLKEYRILLSSIIIGILIKILFNTPVVYGLNKLGFHAFYGVVVTTFLSFVVSCVIIIGYLNKKFNINLESIIKELFNIAIASIIMLVSLIIFNRLFQLNGNNLFEILSVLINFFVGLFIYVFVTAKFKTIKDIFD